MQPQTKSSQKRFETQSKRKKERKKSGVKASSKYSNKIHRKTNASCSAFCKYVSKRRNVKSTFLFILGIGGFKVRTCSVTAHRKQTKKKAKNLKSGTRSGHGAEKP